ncbi:hypothetical protein BCY84_06466 [Trypanosoma cruzi cruzi]|nr:hypothetical protein BCY84_06466 [Trypanosoma cruzi cruzi]
MKGREGEYVNVHEREKFAIGIHSEGGREEIHVHAHIYGQLLCSCKCPFLSLSVCVCMHIWMCACVCLHDCCTYLFIYLSSLSSVISLVATRNGGREEVKKRTTTKKNK